MSLFFFSLEKKKKLKWVKLEDRVLCQIEQRNIYIYQNRVERLKGQVYSVLNHIKVFYKIFDFKIELN